MAENEKSVEQLQQEFECFMKPSLPISEGNDRRCGCSDKGQTATKQETDEIKEQINAMLDIQFGISDDAKLVSGFLNKLSSLSNDAEWLRKYGSSRKKVEVEAARLRRNILCRSDFLHFGQPWNVTRFQA